MLIRRSLFWSAVVLAQLLPAGGLAAESSQSADHGRFVRLARDKDGDPVALEAAIVHYAPMDCGKSGPTVDLISAVHVAEPGFYSELNRRFATYDAVLYELVAPKGTRIPKGAKAKNDNPVSAMQNGMTAMLDLQFQLEGIDYTRPNLIHADMSPEQFSRSMRDRNESMLQVFLRMMGYAMSKQESAAGASDTKLLLALFSENRALALKRVMAEQMADMEGSLKAINGPDGSTLISERNKVAIEVLGRQIAAGKQKIAIFYGAGHMPDLQKRLRDDYGLVPVDTEWLKAWNLRDKSASKPKPSDD